MDDNIQSQLQNDQKSQLDKISSFNNTQFQSTNNYDIIDKIFLPIE